MKDHNKIYLKEQKNFFFEKWSILGYTDTNFLKNWRNKQAPQSLILIVHRLLTRYGTGFIYGNNYCSTLQKTFLLNST